MVIYFFHQIFFIKFKEMKIIVLFRFCLRKFLRPLTSLHIFNSLTASVYRRQHFELNVFYNKLMQLNCLILYNGRATSRVGRAICNTTINSVGGIKPVHLFYTQDRKQTNGFVLCVRNLRF